MAPNYVHLKLEEADALFEEDLGHLVYTERDFGGGPIFSMKTCGDARDNCRCSALTGVVGESVACAIYDLRPTNCRRFEPGSDVCDYARRQILGVSDR